MVIARFLDDFFVVLSDDPADNAFILHSLV